MRDRVKTFAQRMRPVVPIGLICGLLALVPYPTCLLKLATGVPCPGCGMTRATLRLFQGDVAGSVAFHPLALPGAAAFVVGVVLAAALPADHPAWERYVRRATAVASVGFMAVWALRMIHVLPWV